MAPKMFTIDIHPEHRNFCKLKECPDLWMPVIYAAVTMGCGYHCNQSMLDLYSCVQRLCVKDYAVADVRATAATEITRGHCKNCDWSAPVACDHCSV